MHSISCRLHRADANTREENEKKGVETGEVRAADLYIRGKKWRMRAYPIQHDRGRHHNQMGTPYAPLASEPRKESDGLDGFSESWHSKKK